MNARKESCHQDSTKTTSLQSFAGSDKKTTRLVKRKAPAEDEVAAELLKVVRESDKLDEDEQFFNSCLPMVRTLSGEKLEFRNSVQQLLLQAVRRSTAARGHGERAWHENPRRTRTRI
ncbi:hypothetical protein ElyMa_000641500 [Elysia marginata]|uniref:BESS domain-containing protein n=1 Tax=Elysia marginata TaxID=1093978 RepID=A0AAV4GCY6_9GAST|nr:hypothetical protein ElyMa_000641500 [Elysia marginata]